jgi:hypothetical protein
MGAGEAGKELGKIATSLKTFPRPSGPKARLKPVALRFYLQFKILF